MVQVQTAVCSCSLTIPERGIKMRGVLYKLLLHTVNKFQATAVRDIRIYFNSYTLGYVKQKPMSRAKQ